MRPNGAAHSPHGTAWSHRRTWLWPVLAAALALLLRLVVLAQVQTLPFSSAPIGDARAYVAWAEEIATGDLLSRAQGVFYQAPLYPYLLAAVRTVASPDSYLLAVRVLQCGGAALACGLLLLIARRQGGSVPGVASAGLFAIHAPALVWDVQIAKESLALSLGIALLALLVGAARAPRAWSFLAAGALLGGLCLLRESALLLAIVGALWIALAFGGEARARRARWLLAWGAGLLLVLAPVALRNLAVSGTLTLTTAQAGPNFFIGNHAEASGSYEPLRTARGDALFERRDATELAELAAGRSLSASEVSRFWWARGFSFWREQPLPAMRLFGRKLRLATQAAELDDTEAGWIYYRQSSWLGALSHFGHFGILVPLACLAFGAGELQPRLRSLLLAWLLAAFGGLAAFYVLGRYRVLLLPPLFLLAGVGVARLTDALRARDGRRALCLLLAAGAGALLVNLPGSTLSAPGLAEANLAQAYALNGRFAESEAAFRRALADKTDFFEARLGLGNLLLVLGRPLEALPHLERARALAPDDGDARQQLRAALDALRADAAARGDDAAAASFAARMQAE